MIYRIKEEFWSWGNDFTITDEKGIGRFRVDCEDDVSILCCCIVIDQVLHDGDDD